MKKKFFLLLPACILVLAAGWALAAGDAADPLATLSYLTGAFTEAVDQRVDQRLNEANLSSGAGAVPAASALSWRSSGRRPGSRERTTRSAPPAPA